jgi:hypothetical protein
VKAKAGAEAEKPAEAVAAVILREERRVEEAAEVGRVDR